ncbi:lysozyme family protein [Bacillus sp. T33-2]|uniref:lysozyme family protein n=1 Tax=Bacillus sp. T33-2 TaxID=2054168 RepID=UPI000C75EF11|nr:lysozyme family protein [Bacillus sp. T33-2]PLR95100.1 hypothetical protein CVD19_15715 [Bacillus sp. T33-2]
MKRTPKSPKQKKKIQRNFNIVLVVFSVLFAFIIIDKSIQLFIQDQEKAFSPVEHVLAGDVQKYTPLLQRELKLVNLEEYTVVLSAIMQQESKGKGGDPMQASESAGLPPNTINDPEQSIKQGVKHFQRTVTYGQQKKVDFQTIIQAYNMGIGYIDYVAANGGKHTEEIAKNFSMMQVQKKPNTYNCGGDKQNFRYPYCYGDYTYTTKVTKNIETITVSNPNYAGKLTIEGSL